MQTRHLQPLQISYYIGKQMRRDAEFDNEHLLKRSDPPSPPHTLDQARLIKSRKYGAKPGRYENAPPVAEQ